MIAVPVRFNAFCVVLVVYRSVFVAFLAALLLIVCSFSAHADKLKVVATFSILGDMVHQVGGDNVDLKTLVGPDGDAHVYEPTPADARTIAGADLVVVNGLGFEGWLGRLITASGYTGPVVLATKGVATLESKGVTADPHAWQSIANGKIYVANIRDALVKSDKAHASLYESNAAAYIRKLDELEAWVKLQMDQVPPQKRKVITSHDAFRYFGNAYGVGFIAPLGSTTASEPSAAEIASLIDQVRQQKVQAVFMENMADPRLIRQLESDGGAYVGGTLYSDALSPPDGPAPTYIAMFRHNVTELTQGMMHNK